MEAILTLAQQQANKKISEKNSDRFNQLREECIYKELTEMLGASLINAIIANPTETRFVDILEAKEFEGLDGYNRKHAGIRNILSYLIYARYIGESDVNDTFTGLVRKNRTESESLSDGRIRLLQNDARDIAVSKFALVKEYLTINSTTYPEWKCGVDRKQFKPNFTTLRKTIR